MLLPRLDDKNDMPLVWIELRGLSLSERVFGEVIAYGLFGAYRGMFRVLGDRYRAAANARSLDVVRELTPHPPVNELGFGLTVYRIGGHRLPSRAAM